MSVLYSNMQTAESLELDLDLQHCNFKWILNNVLNKKIVTLWEFIFTSTQQANIISGLYTLSVFSLI